jgi:Glycosyl transferase family 8
MQITRKKNRGSGGSYIVFGCLGCVSYFLLSALIRSKENISTVLSINDAPTLKVSATDTEESSGSKKKAGHHCKNDDFKPEHKVGVWTMLNDNMAYVRGAAKMGRGVRRHTKTPHDLIVMELESKPLGELHWDELSKSGFTRCVVDSIPAPATTRHDLKEKFAVLHVWAMTVYDTVLFIDADTYVQNSLDGLINMDLQGKAIGVTKDIREKKWVDTFNSGVLLLHPDEKEFNRLIKLLNSGLVFDYIMSDQGFLNEVYKDDWFEIGFLNNANLALYRFQRDFWNQHKNEDINIIHYTMQKPWRCSPDGPYGPICKIWIDAQ